MASSCGSCHNSPDKQRLWGCSGKEPALVPTEVLFDGKIVRYHHCPIKFFIPQWCTRFVEIYWYYDKFGSAPKFEDQPLKFIYAAKVYSSELKEQQAFAEVRARST